MMAAPTMPLNMDSIIDAEFETIMPLARAEPAPGPSASAAIHAADGLSLLRGSNPAQSKSAGPDELTPSFLFFTFLAAMVVFWVSGGRALLY
jgi:hypothetical protein